MKVEPTVPIDRLSVKENNPNRLLFFFFVFLFLFIASELPGGWWSVPERENWGRSEFGGDMSHVQPSTCCIRYV